MTLAAWGAAAIVAGVFALLMRGRHPPHLLMLGALAVILITGIIPAGAALAGFSNPGVLTVGALFIVAAGLRQTGVMTLILSRVLGRPRGGISAQLRLGVPVVTASAFLNNTPLVAMLLPVVLDWSRSARIPASKLLLPLSYFAVLGGLCTLVGTSTNLVVHGLLVSAGRPGLGMFDIAWVGVPCALAGLAFMAVASRWLPSRQGDALIPADPRQYTVEMVVAGNGPLAGKSIEGAGLRHLPGLYLMEIQRGEHILPVVDPRERLEAGDQLIFVGVVGSVVDLQRIPGLQPATRQVFKLNAHRAERCFVEAVVSRASPLIGQTIRDGKFRNRYNAVVLAVSREGERVPGRIGDIRLRPGDALLLEALPSFVEQQRDSREFYLVSRFDGSGPPTTAQAPVALMVLAGMVVLGTFGVLTMLQAAFLAATAMVLTRCCSVEAALKAVDGPLLLTIACSFALGGALEQTGAAAAIANTLLYPAGHRPWLALFIIYGVTLLLTELITNNAAAVTMFPIAMAAAAQAGASYQPFVMAVTVAASAGFASPLGYQTHLMVYGPGGYKAVDFLKVGLPMDLLLWAVTCTLAPLAWPF